MLRTTRPGAARDLSAAVAESVERVIAVGGDGTLNEVVGGLLDSGLATPRLPELGFLPAGTGNAAVRAFGLEAVPEAMAAALPPGPSRPLSTSGSFATSAEKGRFFSGSGRDWMQSWFTPWPPGVPGRWECRDFSQVPLSS